MSEEVVTKDLERFEAPTPGAIPPLAYAPAAILSDDEITRVWRIASALASSGMHQTVEDASQAFAKILLGRDLGLTAMQSLMSIDFVKGSPQIRGVTLLSFIRKHPNYEYELVEHTEEKAHLKLFRDKGDGKGLVHFADEEYTFATAEAAGIVPTDRRSPWHTARKNMVLWRCTSNAVKFHCPDLLGGVPVYTEGDSFIESRDGDITAISEGTVVEETTEAIIGTLLVDKKLRKEIVAAIEELNELVPGAWQPARVQMVFTAQPEDFVRTELARIRVEIHEAKEKARVAASLDKPFDDPAKTAARVIENEGTAIEVPLPPDATAPPEDARPAPEPVDATVVDEEDDNPECPVCGLLWLSHTEEKKDACQAAADAETV